MKSQRNPFRSILRILVAIVSLKSIDAKSPFSFDVIFCIVVGELVFAFSVGIICVLFSLNLYRALKLDEFSGQGGTFPIPPVSNGYRTFGPTGRNPPAGVNFSVDPRNEGVVESGVYELEYDVEEIEPSGAGLFSALKAFTNYLRF